LSILNRGPPRRMHGPAHRADVTTDAQIVTDPSFVVLRLWRHVV